ncbi:hypothetical protein L226DRAFT_573251 [Lentinus tigrinus ALCF2SS1-7]|uniref:Uncharacterized protein n=1 Tax=Lentinus tigrinus ALCF2SS1-6 TaxID=1328759 RepID=A0A5C2S3Q3_9APHY|nr:hypothetical protein L227DRAFT_613192 [Lentinus tigrinus ALCF2SS1-6]RPD72183.1 hypothetical protein L226DRAFT_573251 [Lentinus tigrinus ALCF2SS1-7]
MPSVVGHQLNIARRASPIRLSVWVAASLAICLSFYFVGRAADDSVAAAILPPHTHNHIEDSKVTLTPLDQDIDFPALAQIQGATLAELLQKGAQGADLAFHLRDVADGVKDLTIAVLGSNLTTRASIADALVDYAVDAKAAARALRMISSRIATMFDDMETINTYALHSLRALHAVELAGVSGDFSTHLMAQIFKVSVQTFSSDIDEIATTSSGALYQLHLAAQRLSTVRGTISATFPPPSLVARLFRGHLNSFVGVGKQTAVLQDAEDCLIASTPYVQSVVCVLLQVKADLGELQNSLTTGSRTVMPATAIDLQLASIEQVVHDMVVAKWRLKNVDDQ